VEMLPLEFGITVESLIDETPCGPFGQRSTLESVG
jgi:hypothetical protein